MELDKAFIPLSIATISSAGTREICPPADTATRICTWSSAKTTLPLDRLLSLSILGDIQALASTLSDFTNSFAGDHYFVAARRMWRKPMRAMALGALVIVLNCASAYSEDQLDYHDESHDAMHWWYKTLRHPKRGYDCCDGRYCRPTRARYENGVLQVMVDGEWTLAPPDSVIIATPPDARTHVCAPVKEPWSPKLIFCVVLGAGV
jgi:hypothetical protein